MIKINSKLVYLIAFLEWFTTLWVEVLAIRKVVPLIWNNIIVTSIILWVIILALSFWYYVWWRISSQNDSYNIARILRNNLVFSAIIYCFVSFMFEVVVLDYLINKFWNYPISILIMSIVLFFVPVFLASQTVPLLTELLIDSKKWESAGIILFYSTIWSFLWSIIPVLIFLPFLWINRSIYIIWLLLIICALVIQFYVIKKNNIKVYMLLLLVFTLSVHDFSISKDIFYFESIYQSILIREINFNNKPTYILSLDWSLSSWIDKQTWTSPFNYIKEAIRLTNIIKPKNILVIWAAWFTFPNEIAENDYVNNIDVIDIDWTLKEISEKYFLKKQLSNKINFIVESWRYFINKTTTQNKKYDLIFVDVYSSKMNIPSEFLTKEYFESISNIWWVILSNIILDWNLSSIFSKNLLKTINSTNSQIYYKNVTWPNNNKFANYIFSNNYFSWYNKINMLTWQIYYDDKNNIEIDKFNLFY